MRAVRSLWLVSTWGVLALTPLAVGCSDDDEGTGPSDQLVGTWNATSFVGMGQDVVALGMDLTLVLTSTTYTLNIDDDLIGACDPGPSCTQSGTYTATATQLTLDPGTPDATTFNYTLQGSTLTFSGVIDGTTVAITFVRD